MLADFRYLISSTWCPGKKISIELPKKQIGMPAKPRKASLTIHGTKQMLKWALVQRVKRLCKGESLFLRKGNVVSVWKDKKPVYFLSTQCNPVGDETVTRRQRDGTCIEVPCVPVVCKLFVEWQQIFARRAFVWIVSRTTPQRILLDRWRQIWKL